MWVEAMTRDTSWHLDKRVPVSIILTLLLQTSGFVWWFAHNSAATEHRLTSIEKTLQSRSEEPARIVRLETEMIELRRSLNKIERSQDRIIQLLQKR